MPVWADAAQLAEYNTRYNRKERGLIKKIEIMETLLRQNGTSQKVMDKVTSKLPEKREEGMVAKTIESLTSRLPSDLFLWTSLSAMGIALGLKMFGKDHAALFIGQWVSPVLVMGLYNKLVKVKGHDKKS
jgi:hypothetical protein